MPYSDIADSSIEIISWYDGIVQATFTSSTGGRFLAILLAFNPDIEQRIWAVISIDPDEHAVLSNQEVAWKETQGRIKEIVTSGEVKAELIMGSRSLLSDASRGPTIDLSEHLDQIGFSVDFATTPASNQYWARVFSCVPEGIAPG